MFNNMRAELIYSCLIQYFQYKMNKNNCRNPSKNVFKELINQHWGLSTIKMPDIGFEITK